MDALKIQWIGHASVKIVFNNKIFYTDPWIVDNPDCKIRLSDTKDANIVCVTHGHGDHLGDSIAITKDSKAKMICTPEIGHYAEIHGLDYGKKTIALNIGGSWKYEIILLRWSLPYIPPILWVKNGKSIRKLCLDQEL